MPRPCSECGEEIPAQRLQALPDARQCVECANRSAAARILPAKSIVDKPVVTGTSGVKRYLANVGQKTDLRALFGMLVRISYLFPHISAAELTPILIQWSKRTNTTFGQDQLRKMILDAKQWVLDHPNDPRRAHSTAVARKPVVR